MAEPNRSRKRARGPARGRSAPRPASRRYGLWPVLITVVVVAGMIVTLFLSFGNDDDDSLASDRQEVERFTNQVADLIAALEEPVGGMFQSLPDAPETLADDVERWLEELDQANEVIIDFDTPEELDEIDVVLSRVVELYTSTAQTVQTAARLEEGSARNDLLRYADDLRYIADQYVQVGLTLIDKRRVELGLRPSGLNQPGS